MARRRRAERFCACGALAALYRGRSTRTLYVMTSASKRQLLSWGVASIAVLGLAFAAVPFLESWRPNPSVKAALPVHEVKDMKAGELRKLDSEVWIYRRTEDDLKLLGAYDEYLADPRSEKSSQPLAVANQWRSVRPDYFIFFPGAPYRGCAVQLVPANTGDYPYFAEGSVVSQLNHFYEPCEGRTFDVAGRVFSRPRWPEERNLRVPDIEWVTETKFAFR